MATASSARILVSGASGPIGAALLPALQASHYETTRLVRGPVSGSGQISWDPARSMTPASVSGFEAVIHLAGESIVGRWTAAKKARIRDSRLQGTRHLVAALVASPQPPRAFICASAIGYYGSRGEEILREDSAPGRDFLAGVCREWEAATQPATAAGIRTANPRFGVVLSLQGGALPKMLTPFRLGVGGNMGNGRQWWSWISAEDVAGAILHLLKTDVSGPVNFVSPNPVTNAEFTKTLAAVLSRPAIFPMPAFAARFIFGEMADELLLASQRVEPAKLSGSGYAFKDPDLRDALKGILGR